MLFHPLVFEAGGFIQERTKQLLFKTADRDAQRQSLATSWCRKTLLHRISTAIQLGNARAIRNHRKHLADQAFDGSSPLYSAVLIQPADFDFD